jgi:hypothetical protein
MLLVEQTGAGDAAGPGSIFMNEVGDQPNQCFDWQPGSRFYSWIQGGVFRLEPSLAAAIATHVFSSAVGALALGERKRAVLRTV